MWDHWTIYYTDSFSTPILRIFMYLFVYTGDFLPCLLELRRAVASGAELLAQKDEQFKHICGLEKVKAASNPNATALALYLQDLEHKCICDVAAEASTMGVRIMSYVFDGLYVLARSDEHLHSV